MILHDFCMTPAQGPVDFQTGKSRVADIQNYNGIGLEAFAVPFFKNIYQIYAKLDEGEFLRNHKSRS